MTTVSRKPMDSTDLPPPHEPTPPAMPPARHLDNLESEAIYILRETAAEFANPVLLFSGGKDSTILLRLAEKAFRPGKFPFPLLHVDTGQNFPEVIEFRDRIAAQLGERLIVRTVQDSIDSGRIRLKSKDQSRNALQSVTLLDAIAEFEFDACIGGARRDEEKARAKERIFSFRNSFGQWDPRHQRPELWSLYNGRLDKGEHMRVFPLSNWTEIDVWRYIQREKLALPDLYYAHSRSVAVRGSTLLPVSEFVPLREDEEIETRVVRFRTVGDISCTLPVESNAATVEDVIAETLIASLSERGATRLDDQASEASMEERKRAGYF
jgi:sulfate adenylyltransferase subunit 2